MTKADTEKAARLIRWLIGDGERPMKDKTNGECILIDAINQATKAETIEWLAAIAERYGFKDTTT